MTDERGPPQWILDTIANRTPDEARETILYHLGGIVPSPPVEVRAVYHSSDSDGYWAELADGRIAPIRRGAYYDLSERLLAPPIEKLTRSTLLLF